MHFRPRSIRAKLLAVFVVAGVLPMGVLGLVFYYTSTRAVADMAGNRSVRIAQEVRAELDRKLEERAQDRLLVTNEPVQVVLAEAGTRGRLSDGPPLRNLRRYLRSLFGQYGDYYDQVILADREGRPLLRFDREAGTYVSGASPTAYPVEPPPAGPPTGAGEGTLPTYRGAALSTATPGFRESDRLALRSAPEIPDGGYRVRVDPIESGHPPTVSILRPVESNEPPHERLGYVLARVRAPYLWPEDLVNRRFGQQGHLVIADLESGGILYHTQRDCIGRRLGQLDPELYRVTASPRKAGADSASWRWVGGEAAGPRVAANVTASLVPWEVIVTASPSEFASEARKAGLFNLIVASAALLAGALVLVLASGRLSRSIGLLTAGARRIAGGDLGGPPIQAETHDEIETLAETFNTMTASLRRNVAMREEAAAELDALNRSLEARVHARTQELETLNAALNQANEDLKELDKLKSNFLATVSHEFKTPLTSIKAFAEILHDELEEQGVSEELTRFLRIIDSESDRLARLIKNVLDLSQIESGQMRWRMADFPVASVIDATVDGLLPALKEKQIRLERDVRCSETQLHGDADRIQEVITNVLDNAIKASPEGERIVIGCREEDSRENGQPRMLRVFVSDYGHGIPPDQLTRIFDRFHQVSSQGRRRKGGTGLGLAISREITEHHGGRIWAESEPGIGSTFHMTLPLATGSRPPGPSPGSPTQSEGELPGDPLHA
jgi:signal transduction histidine kinase